MRGGGLCALSLVKPVLGVHWKRSASLGGVGKLNGCNRYGGGCGACLAVAKIAELHEGPPAVIQQHIVQLYIPAGKSLKKGVNECAIAITALPLTRADKSTCREEPFPSGG